MANPVQKDQQNNIFSLESDFQPAGDQPQAIAELAQGLLDGKQNQVLLGVTGSGKTFTMAHIIQKLQRPAIIMAHNKTLAAQLYSEMRSFFPHNAVEYYVSYYDYYQPEAYIPKNDVYIEKDSSINEQIDRMRHAATRALLERRDVIVVASVSCIYGLGAPETYLEMTVSLETGQEIALSLLTKQLIELQYERNDIAFPRGSFRLRGDTLDIFPSHSEDRAWRLSFFGDEIESIHEFDTLTGKRISTMDTVTVFANSHFVTPRPTMQQAMVSIKQELKERLNYLDKAGKLVEAQRLEQRTQFDLEMIMETGSCKGVENYSRYLSGRNEGEPPPTLFEYLPENSLLFVDESHVSVPQVGGMYNGDRARKTNLIDYGFRLTSALDNRPLKFDEWDKMRPQTVFVSATPANAELEYTQGEFVQQVIRPTGLLDPVCDIRPIDGQVDDLMAECKDRTAKGERVLVTTLTKKMSENLTDYLLDNGLKVTYLHSDVDTLERIEILHDLRRGVFDVLVGINLLREGLDIPECSLVLILDADKAGFLRSETALIQTIGRAARHVNGRVILYADVMTAALTSAIGETERRRKVQKEYNKKHNITPQSIIKQLGERLKDEEPASPEMQKLQPMSEKERAAYISEMRKQMLEAASNLEFEKAASLRDDINSLEKTMLGL